MLLFLGAILVSIFHVLTFKSTLHVLLFFISTIFYFVM